MEKLFKITLDRKSEYVCDKRRWPKAVCDVMVESDELIDLARLVFGKEDGDGYVDIYAMIEPERRLVTEFLVIFKDLEDTQEELTIKVSSPASSVHYYKELEKQGGKEFEEFIAESVASINGERAEYSGCLVDVVDDFLEKREIRVPSSDYEMKVAGDWNEEGYNAARIYGPDYDELVNSFEKTLHWSSQAALKDRIDALLQYYSEAGNELDYYTELKEIGITLGQIESWYGELEMEHTKSFWEEHGLA